MSFQKLLRPELFLPISSSGDLHVKESDISAVLRNLLIKRVPDNCVAFELDHSPKGDLKKNLKNAFVQFSNLIYGQHPTANKKCDFVIVEQGSDKTKIILGDLKSCRPKKSQCAAQLRNSELFVQYILALISEYHIEEIKPEFKKVIFYVVDPIKVKAPTQQKNRRKLCIDGDVSYLPVTVAGRQNSCAVVSYAHFC